jgi:hypothetical protein
MTDNLKEKTRAITVGRLIDEAELFGAGEISIAYRDEDENFEFGVIVILGDGGDEMWDALTKTKEEIQDKWYNELEAENELSS